MQETTFPRNDILNPHWVLRSPKYREMGGGAGYVKRNVGFEMKNEKFMIFFILEKKRNARNDIPNPHPLLRI